MSDNEAKNKPIEKEEGEMLATIPYVAHEYTVSRYQRIIKWLLIGLMVSILVSFAKDLAWLVAWCQYDYYDSEVVEIDAGDGGNANYIGNDGDIYNGANQSNENSQT